MYVQKAEIGNCGISDSGLLYLFVVVIFVVFEFLIKLLLPHLKM